MTGKRVEGGDCDFTVNPIAGRGDERFPRGALETRTGAGYFGIFLWFGSRVIGNVANNNGEAGIVVFGCPNLVLENMANGNGSFNTCEYDGCDVSQENSPAP